LSTTLTLVAAAAWSEAKGAAAEGREVVMVSEILEREAACALGAENKPIINRRNSSRNNVFFINPIA
jgi:hypothetical protein